MKRFILGIIVGVAIVVGGVYFYFSSGRAPVATSAQPMPFETMLARKALHARLEKEMPQTSPIEVSEDALRAGAQVYVEHCAVCHGTPSQAQTAIAQGEYPKPPQLMHGKGVTDDPPGESYWKVANGIRMTGMPGFNRSLSDTQMWQVTLLVSNADKLPDSVKQILASPPAATASAH